MVNWRRVTVFDIRTTEKVVAVLGLLLGFVALHGCQQPSSQEVQNNPAPAAIFAAMDPAKEPHFTHFNGMSGSLLPLELLGPGVALFDYDNDGDLDLYVVQGRMLGANKTLEDATFAPQHESPLTDRLYRNDLVPGRPESLRFTDVTEATAIRALGYGMGVTVGDYDADGWVDIYVTNFGANQLWRNRGDGTFEDVSQISNTEDPNWSVPAVFFDYDHDQRLDLYVGNYIDFDPDDNSRSCTDLTGAADYCGPNGFPSQPDRMLRNMGDGTFVDVTEASGLAAKARPALGAVVTDFDADGDLDLYVANDDQPNYLFINNGSGQFQEQALSRGVAVNNGGMAESSMGVDSGDFDGDNDFDLFMTHLTRETNTLYLNDGSGSFSDLTDVARLSAPSLLYTSFGTAGCDYDNDGRLDLIVVNGRIARDPVLAGKGDPFPLHQPNQVFRNVGSGSFEDVTALSGEGFQRSEVSRGLAIGDLDNDGDSDLAIANNSGPLRVLVNQIGSQNHWLGVQLTEGEPSRVALAATTTLDRSGEVPLLRQVRVDGSYASANDSRVLFGLGANPDTGTLRVRWSDGVVEEWRNLPVDSYNHLHRGSGTPSTLQ